jgi:hypothetical protein
VALGMARLLLVAAGLAAALGCAGFDLTRPTAGTVERRAHTTFRGEGWTARLPEGARVEATADLLRVDAPEGDRWFDVHWMERPQAPIVAASRWAAERCQPMLWDEPATPRPGTWTAGGLCTIGEGRYYGLVVLEDLGERTLLTGYIARRGNLAYEDVWVDVIGTALSVSTADTPPTWLAPADVRATLRKLPPVSEVSLRPVPGGGLFSQRASLALTALWEARAGVAVPAAFSSAPTSP